LARRLDQEHVSPPHVLVDLAGSFGVWKAVERDPPQRDIQVVANPLGQLRIGSSAKDLQLVHGYPSFSASDSTASNSSVVKKLGLSEIVPPPLPAREHGDQPPER
jgi:hypothetical protein